MAGMNWADKPETPAGSTGQQPPSPLQGNDSKKTIQETGNSPNIGQTLDAAAMAGMNWAEAPANPPQPPAGSGNDPKATIVEDNNPNKESGEILPPADSTKKPGTVYDRGAGATIDFSQLPGGAPPAGPGTVFDRGAGATIDFGQLAAQRGVPGGQPGDSASAARAADFGDISPEEAARVTRIWQSAADPGASPRMTMKGSIGPGGGKKSTLVVQPRSLQMLEKDAAPGSLGNLDYELLSVLGEGGMGVVYAARQASIDRTVAIKMVKSHVAGDHEQRSKFLSEAVVTGELEHPNIVPIYDLGSNDKGALFYSMKKVQGTPWMKVVERKSLNENIEILMKVADAVAFAHSRGVVHRDLKPENVMLGEYGEVLVMDWGLAMSMPGFRKAQNINQSVGMGGTPAYMAPEMATGPFEKIGPDSDVYLLGAILFEIITGTTPHAGRTTMHCLMAAGRNDIVPTQKSGELLNIAMKAMATDPDDRYPGVIAFQNAIREYEAHSESIALSVRAAEELAEAEKTNEYQTYARAVFGYEEAVALWPGNERAKRELKQARLAYARSAQGKGDFDLGLSLLDPNEADHADIRREITLAQAEREARQQRLKNAKRLMVGMVGAILVVISGAFVITWQQRNLAIAAKEQALVAKAAATEERNKAIIAEGEANKQRALALVERDRAVSAEKVVREQRDEVEEKRKEAVAAKEEAVEAKNLAEMQRKKAVEAQKKAELAKMKEAEQRELAVAAKEEAEKAREEEVVARKAAVKAKELAVEAKEKEEVARLAAEKAREAEAEQRRLAVVAQKQESKARRAAEIAKVAAERAKLAEEYEAYIARIGLAAAKIDENAFDHAAQLLDECQPLALRNWEWGRLKHLCGQSTETFTADAPIDSVAWSPNGQRFVAGSWDGLARIWQVGGNNPPLQIPYGGSYVQAVAFSPDGQWVATGGNDRRGFVRLWNAETGKPRPVAFKGHEDSVLSVAFSRDGKKLLTSSYDKTARLWDVETGEELRVFRGHHWWVWAAIFSPDEKRVITASQDGTALVWDLAKNETRSLPMFTGHTGPVYTLAISPDGQRVASGGYDNRVLIWNVDDVKPFDFKQLVTTGKVDPPQYRALEGHTAAIRSVRFSKDGKLLLTAGQDNAVKVWDVESGKTLKTLRGHAGWVRSCAFSPDGHWVLSGSHDHEAKIWSIEGYEEVRVLRGRVLEGHTDGVMAARFSPNGQRVVTASRDRTARLWDVATAKELKMLEEGHEFLASNAAFFADGQHLVTAAVDNTARVWDVSTGTETLRLEGTGRAAALALSRDGQRIATGGLNRLAQIWNATTGELLFKLDAHPAEVTAAAFSPDGRLLLTGDADGHARLWNTADGKLLHKLTGHTRKIVAAAFTADGSRGLTASADNTVGQWDIATGQERRDLTLKPKVAVRAMAVASKGSVAVVSTDDGKAVVWNIDKAEPVGALSDPSGDINGLSISPDARRVLTVSTSDRTVRLWDLATRKEISPAGRSGQPFLDLNARGGVVWTAIFAPDSQNLLTVGGEGARLWNIASNAERISFSPHGSVASASFSPDGKQVVTGSWDNSAKIWNVASGHAEQKLTGGHTQYINSAVFSRDGSQVLTASDDKTACLWSLAETKVIQTFRGHTERVRSAAFSPDGTQVLTASNDNTARIWDAATAETLLTLEGHEYAVLCAAYSDDGRFVITGSEDNSARVWDAATGRELMRLQGHTAPVTSAAFSPDGTRALTGSRDNACKLWDTAPVAAPRRIALNLPVEQPEADEAEEADGPAEEMPADDEEAAEEDADEVAAADEADGGDDVEKAEEDGMEEELDEDGNELPAGLVRGKEILTLAGHSQEVTSVCFSPDGRYVLTGSRDGTAFIWLTSDWKAGSEPEPRPIGETARLPE
ncbi:MAG: protein kinase [Pirellulales bacterium]